MNAQFRRVGSSAAADMFFGGKRAGDKCPGSRCPTFDERDPFTAAVHVVGGPRETVATTQVARCRPTTCSQSQQLVGDQSLRTITSPLQDSQQTRPPVRHGGSRWQFTRVGEESSSITQHLLTSNKTLFTKGDFRV